MSEVQGFIARRWHNHVSLRLAQRLLEREGHSVAVAKNRQEWPRGAPAAWLAAFFGVELASSWWRLVASPVLAFVASRVLT